MLRHVAQKFTPKYVPIRSLVQNTNGNGTESLQFIKRTENNQLLKFGGLTLTAVGMTGAGACGLFAMMRKEVKDAVSPIDSKLNKLDDRTHTLAIDMACVKTHLGLTDSPASPASPASPVSPVSPPKPGTK